MVLPLTTGTPDGRRFDVYVDGPKIAVPLLFHNGTPSSEQLFAPFVEAASQRGLRMVSFSRAGYGSWTRNPGRIVANVISDVTAVLDHLGAHRFYTLGWSGGGPHALACAALLPGRLIGAATVAHAGHAVQAFCAVRGQASLRDGHRPCVSATWSPTWTARRSVEKLPRGWRKSSRSR